MLERVCAGTPLRLVRQPDNPYDANACALFDPHGDQVGFLNRRLAAALAPTIDAGVEYDVEVTDVTGGEGDALARRQRAPHAPRRCRDVGRARRATRGNAERSSAALDPAALDAELTRRFIGDRSLHEAQARSLAHLAQGDVDAHA